MKKRSIQKIYPAYRDDIEDLKTVRPLPSPQIQYLDPFLFLNHHGPQVYPSPNGGLPFGPHPHRGFQTVTFILDGDIAHRDSGGHESIMGPGGVQWMSAGSGLVHEEVSSAQFMKRGGPLEILQLWVNLPAKDKMSAPYYKGLQENEIPQIVSDNRKVQVISGSFQNQKGPFTPSTDLRVLTFDLKANAEVEIPVESGRKIFFYVVRGSVEIDNQQVQKTHLVDFNNDGDGLKFKALDDAYVLYCDAVPYEEPVVSMGPFVMNTEQEIHQAIADYRAGKFKGLS